MNIQIVQHNKTPSESVDRILQKLDQKAPHVLHYGKAVDKITQYQYFKDNGIPHPEWTTEPEVAEQWLKDKHTVVCRTKIKSATGAGITLVSPPKTSFPEAKVYTKYQKKKREFRVNLFQGEVVNIREKKSMGGVTAPVWNYENNYTTTHVTKPIKGESLLKDLAVKASKVSNSDFVGVDVIYNEFYDKFFVLEVNSGPSIEGSSVEDFCNLIVKKFK